MNIVTLETERLILRPFNENDLDAFFRIYSDKKVNQFLPWYPVQTKEEAKQFYEKRYAHSKDYRYAICLKEDSIPIGYVNVSMNESHDFGYGLLEAYWRQGIVSEACRAVLAQLKKEGLRYITATHDVRNTHSGYVMKSIGMSYQYTYEEQWQPKNILVQFRMYQYNFNEGDHFVYKQYWEMYENHFIEENV